MAEGLALVQGSRRLENGSQLVMEQERVSVLLTQRSSGLPASLPAVSSALSAEPTKAPKS